MVNSFVLSRFSDTITVDKSFRDSIIMELNSNNMLGGTILLAANEILFNFDFTFAANGVGSNGQFDIVLVADRFNSNGRTIELNGHYGGDAVGQPSKDPLNNGGDATADSSAGNGKQGHRGNPGGNGGNGMNIKVFCNELIDIKIISNGGRGGNGGKGGEGGDGGQGGTFEIGFPPHVHTKIREEGKAGKGGPGGPGGKGGNGGKIELLFCNAQTLPTDLVASGHLVSNGNGPGGGGIGGDPGKGEPPHEQGNSGGNLGPGIPSTPDIKKIEYSELWERVRIELGIPA